MQSFKIQGARRMVFGAGAISTLPEEIEKFGAKKVLVVMDQGLCRLEFPDRVMAPLKANGIEAVLFGDLEPEPSPNSADAGAAVAMELGADLVVGVGGGSSMDVAKAVAMLAKNPGQARDYIGLGLVKRPGLPTIMVPTTAGTGSEVTFTAVFTMRESKSKGGINDEKLYPHLALLDPELTLGCPSNVTAFTGMDALTHAIESYTSLNANPVSDIYALEAIRLIGANLREAVFHGDDLEARTNMLLGSYLAGLGLANAGVGAVHALAYPLGALFGINHGTANAVLLPYVMEFNVPASVDRFSDVAWALGEPCADLSQRDAAAAAVEAVLALSEDIGIPEGLTDLDIPEDAIEELAVGAMKVARPIANNPRLVLFEDAVEIYKNAY
ncbi:MAG: iron-containing alcohol dehydrogenase [Deltaproteobacteria bacterium]|nr:iron-containing alcohol dehydrogenase [Deltaproteobacteria bacterium]